MSRNACHTLREAGTAVWLDQLSRELIRQGKLQSLMKDAALTGVTSNPAIFHKAMTAGSAYDDQIAELRNSSLSPEQIYEHLAVRDIQTACDILRPVWEETKGADGFVSLEVSPHLALDAEGSMAAARRFHEWVKRPNLFIKIPGTTEGIPAIGRLLAEGIAINITLLFSVEKYEEVAHAYVRALQERASKGLSLDVPSVASFFVSRIDTLADQKLEEAAARAGAPKVRDELLELRGRAAVANAKVAYQSFLRIFGDNEFRELQAKGARVQRPLWASTSTKNPSYRDVMYVEPLVGRDTVNTMPMETIEAFLDHGRVLPNSVELGVVEAQHVLQRLDEAGIPFRGVTDQLLAEGIAKFNEPYDKLLKSLEERLRK
jgi:transaldolase